jgi:hypothetical protein
MGTYTQLYIDEYLIWDTKSQVDPVVMTMSRETDKLCFERRVADRNVLVWGESRGHDDDEREPAVVYSCLASSAIDRLNVMGFTMNRSREEFQLVRNVELERLESWSKEDGDKEWMMPEWEFMKGFGFDDYVEGLRHVLAQRLLPWAFDEAGPESNSPLLRHMLRRDDNDYPLGFLGRDIRFLLRIACELVDRRAKVFQDITDLVAGGYYRADECVCEEAIRSLTATHPQNSTRIILTEGSTDREILEISLRILLPHLAGYYSFMDFDASRSQGGAGHLVSIIKAFAGAGITNRVIAIFDNDTAAFEARRVLAQIRLPANIAVRNYPDLESLRAYPTLGPGGQSNMDVNGLAGSVELYLGSDVLAEGGAMPPVQWKGFSEALRKYQGEVMHKDRLHAAFRAKAERCLSSPDEIPSCDWAGLRAILSVILEAFD